MNNVAQRRHILNGNPTHLIAANHIGNIVVDKVIISVFLKVKIYKINTFPSLNIIHCEYSAFIIVKYLTVFKSEKTVQIDPLHDDVKNQNKPGAVCIVGFIGVR